MICASLQACGVVFRFAISTSICRSSVTICSGLYLFKGASFQMPMFTSRMSKATKEQKILFWKDTIHAQRVQLQQPEVTAVLDIDQNAAAATRLPLLPKLAREDVLIAGPRMPFPALGRLRKEGSGYSWVPVVFADRWDEK